MHILFGAVVGAVFAVVMTAGIALLQGKKPNWKHVALAALGGAVAGAVASATLGAGSFAAAGLGRQVVGFGLGGAAGGATEQVGENAFEGRPLHENVGTATVVGAATGVASLGATHAGTAITSRVLPRVLPNLTARVTSGVNGVAEATPTLLRRVMAAPTPGTGSGIRRGLDDYFEGLRDDVRERLRERRERRAELAAAACPPTGAAAPAQQAPTPGFAGALDASF